MGRHHRQNSLRPVPTVVLGLTVLSATGPLLLMAIAPQVADAKGTLLDTETTQEMRLALPTPPTTQIQDTPTPTGKVDKDGNPVSTSTARRTKTVPTTTTKANKPTVAQRQISKARVTTTTTTRPKETRAQTTTASRPRSTSAVTTRARIVPNTTPRVTPTPKPTPRPTQNTPTSRSTSATATSVVSSGRTAGLGLAPSAAKATEDILKATGFTGTLIGRASRPNNPTSDHPRGYAVDFMTTNLAMGNAIKNYALANQVRLGVKYVIWQEPAHYDHVHISFVG